jgi:hypothetical protein
MYVSPSVLWPIVVSYLYMPAQRTMWSSFYLQDAWRESVHQETSSEGRYIDFATRLLQETGYLDISSKFILALRPVELRRAEITCELICHIIFVTHNPFHRALAVSCTTLHTHPGLPLTASGLRFRLTPNSSPASFRNGTDLLAPYGMPWRIQVFSRAKFVILGPFL